MKAILFLMAICALGLYGCVPVTVPAPAAPTTAALSSPLALRVGFPSNADVGDVPSLMAHELLRAQGYQVESQNFAGADLEIAALTKGDIEIGNGSMRTLYLALDKAPLAATIMEQVADNWLLVTKAEYKTCDELQDARIAFTSTSSLSYALFDAFKQQDCPDLEYLQMLISSSSNRAAALQAGEIDATPLSLADWLQVEQEEPGRFHVLVNFAQELDELKTTGIHVNRQFAQEHPQAVRDYIRAVLTVHRTIESNPNALEEGIVRYLQYDPETARAVATAYLDLHMWDVNGGLTRDDVKHTIDFFTKSGALPEGLTAEGVADLSYLDAVLEEMGRE